MPLEELGEVDLVGAAQDAHRVVDDDHALGVGATSEAVGEVVDARGGTDEQGIELGDVGVVVLADDPGVHAELARDALKARDGAIVGGRLGLVGIGEDGEVVLGGAVAVRAPAAGEVGLGRLLGELLVGLGDLLAADGADADDLPAAVLATGEAGAKERNREELMDARGEPIVALGHVVAEVDAEDEALGLDGAEALVDQLVELAGANADDLGALEILNRGDVGHGPMAAGGGEQRDVVAGALVAVRAAQVEGLDAATGPAIGIGEVVAGVDALDARQVVEPGIVVVGDEQVSHESAFSVGRSMAMRLPS